MRSFADFFGVQDFSYFEIFTNNYCNLRCAHCSALCNIPLSKDAVNPFRRDATIASLEYADLFCKRFKGIGEGDFHRLSGGEPTAVPVFTEQLIYLLTSYGRRVDILTNGYALFDLKRKALKKLSRVVLDNHGVNADHVKDCKRYVEKQGVPVEVWNMTFHYDLNAARQHPSNKGLRCDGWMTTPTMMPDGVIYPCCSLHWVMAREKNTQVRDALKEAGWIIQNEGVAETMRDHANTVPAVAIEHCENRCWQPNPGVVPHKTLSFPKDVSVSYGDKNIYIKIHGLMRTGTNYLELLLQKNFENVKVLCNELGWKHGPILDAADWSEENKRLWNDYRAHWLTRSLRRATRNGAIWYCVMVKEPYSWLWSIAKRQRRPASPVKVSDVEHWNKRLASWTAYCDEHPDKTMLMRYETLLQDTDVMLGQIEAKFSLTRKGNSFVNVNERMTTTGRASNKPFDASFFTERKYLKSFTAEDIEAVNAVLCSELMQRFGYEYVQPSGVGV